MKAILNEDMIVYIVERGNVEIGLIPKDVGLERLRFDGQKVIDLVTLSEMWVRIIGPGAFELHVIKVFASQLVTMGYGDRKNLTVENGIIRVKTSQEIKQEQKDGKKEILRNRLRQTLKIETGTLEEQISSLYQLVFALVVYARTQNSLIETFFDEIIPDIKDAYPLDRIKPELKDLAKTLKLRMTEFYDAIDQV